LLEGLALALTPASMLATVMGVALGLVIGWIPGLSATMGVALLVPVTFVMSPESGMIMLSGVYAAAIYGGSVSAVLLNVPGTPASIVTTWDGYPLTRQGQAMLALGTSILASFCGGMISAIVLLLFAPVLAGWALRFGPAEYFALALFAMTIVASLAADAPLKGFIAASVGLFLASVGFDPLVGQPRFWFRIPELASGFNLVAVLIGLFAIPEAISLAAAARARRVKVPPPVEGGRLFPDRAELGRNWVNLLRSSFIGVGLGTLPAIGPETAPFVSYNEARRASKRREQFGKGSIEGIIAAEAANNGTTGGSLIPLLTLGIPGSATAAVFLGALTIHGLRPGPLLFTSRPELVYALFFGFILVNVVMLLIALASIRRFAPQVLRLPPGVLAAFICVFSVVGAYAVESSLFGVLVMVAFGGVGYVMRRQAFPPGPLVLGLVVGPLLEENMVRMLASFRGDWLAILSRPVTSFFLLLAVATLVLPALKGWRGRHRARGAARSE
jgi:putative tricarboxylic transport membrane protein